MATFTQMGSVINQPATITSSSTQGMVPQVSAYADDDFVTVILPFNVQFYNNLITSWFVGSNSYLTKTGQTAYNPTSTMDVGVYVSASDNSYDYVGLLTSADGNSFTIHFEGNNSYNDGASNLFWDATFFKDGVIQIVTDPYNFQLSTNGFSCLSNMDTSTQCNFSAVINQSYVFIPNSDFSGYTVQTGVSYSYTPVANNYPPTVPTNISSSVNGTTTTISGVVHDQDGGGNQLVVDYSTDQTFATGVVTKSSTSINVESTGNVVISGLSSNTTYYFRVRGYDGTNYSSYSSTMNFTTGNIAQPILSNLSPASQTRYTSLSNQLLGATATSPNNISSSLTFQISKDSTFATGVSTYTSSTVLSGQSTSVSVTQTNTTGTYYWRVRATDTNGLNSVWSTARVIYVDTSGSQNLAPDGIVSETNTTGAISTINDSPSTPDTTFMTPTTSGTAMNVTASFPTPTSSLKTGAGLQTFTVYSKRSNTNGTVTMTISVLENGTTIATSSAITVSSTTGQTDTFTWDATGLTDKTGASVQIKIVTTAYSGGGAKKTDVNIGAVQWTANYAITNATVSDPTPFDTTPPSVPTGLTANASNSQVSLSWNSNSESDFEAYNIYRSTDNISYSSIRNLLLNTSYVDTTVTNGTQYYYKITSVDTTGNESAKSSSVTATPQSAPDTTPPANVTNLSASKTTTTATLTWTNPTDSDFNHVNIYRGVTLLGQSTTGSFSDSGLTPSTTYTYKATSVDNTGNESTGSTLSVTTLTPDTTPPSNVTGLSANETLSSVSLTWINPSDSDFTKVNIYKNGSLLTSINYSPSSNGSYTDNGLSSSTQYSYKVTSVDSTGNESLGSTLNATTLTPDTTAPANVTNLVATPSHTTASITWTNPSDSDFSKVKIYRNSLLIASPTYSPSSNGSYNDSGLQFSTAYSYKVTSVDTTGNESTGTTVNTTTLTDNIPPSTPTGLNAVGGNAKVILSWNANSEQDLSSYTLYKSTDGTNFSSYLTGLTGTTYTDNSVTNGNTYYYKLTAVDTTGNESTQTSLVSATPNLNQAPSTPVNLFPFNTSAWTKLHFEADVTDVDSTSLTFYVDYSTDSTLATGITTLSSPVTLPSVGSTVRASITSATTVSEGTVYYWRAYTKDSLNAQSPYSPTFHFTIKNASGDNMVPDGTPFMQQGSYSGNINFIDVSDYQGTITWSQVKSSGINYAILCTRHALADDTLFTTYVSQAKSAGIKTGGYFFPNPAYPLDLNDARTQAEHFSSLLQAGYGTGQYGDLIPMIDLEDNTSRVSGSQSYTILSLTVDDMLAWVNEFRNHFESITGRTLGLYTVEDFVRTQRNSFNYDYNTGGAVAGTNGNVIIDMPLWISGFTGYSRYMGGVMPSVGGWYKWQAFQHGDTSYGEFTVNGISGTTDLDWAMPIEWISPPNPTTGVSATDNGTDILLTWNATTEQDVHRWDVYVDGTKVGSTNTNGSYTITSPTTDVQHTIEVRPIDDYGDKPIVSANTITYTLIGNPNPPLVTSLTASRIKIGAVAISDDNKSTVTFTFDSNVKTFLVNVNGTSYDSGVVIASGGSQTVSQVAGETVSLLSTEIVRELLMIPSGNQISIVIDNSEIPGGEGAYQINIYGQSNSNSKWTLYESGN